MNNIKIGVKLIGGFIIVALIAGVIGVFGISSMKTIDNADTVLFEKMTVPLGILVDYSTAYQRIRINLRDMIRANDPAQLEKFQAAIDGLDNQLAKGEEEYRKTFIDKNDEDIFNDFIQKKNAYDAFATEIQNLAQQNKDAEAYALLDGAALSAGKIANEAIDKITNMNVAAAKAQSDSNTKTASSATFIMIIVMIIGVVLAVIIGIFLTISITTPLVKGVNMMLEMAKGHLGTRLKMNRKDEIGQLADAMDTFSEDLQKNIVATVIKIGEGDLSVDLKPKDAQDEIIPAIMNTTTALRGLIAEAGMLRKAAIDGKLATRGKAENFKGGYKDIVQGVNDCLDAVIGPLNVAAEYVDRISKGDIPAKITDNYNGDFNEIKNNLNKCIEAISGLITEMTNMSQQHDLGDIDVYIPADKFQGAYKQMGESTNKMVNGHISVKKKAMACIAELGKGNFDAPLEKFPGKKVFINNTIEALRDNLKNVSIEIGSLIEASKNGSLSTRGKSDNYQGDWQKIVKGINEMLDAILMPINEAAAILEKVAARDMSARVKGDYKGDHAKIKVSLNSAVENLDTALQQVAEGVEQVSSAGQQISAGSQSLAQGANEQASSLEEVSSSLEEMSSMTKQNAENANQAKTLAGEANTNAAQGKQAMARMSDAINKIKESSDQTAKIVKTIDEIAMQTNLLALNAAVEAARAGEAGRGFAVVAEEVRNLAQRSAQAAKNTADMIAESVKNSEDGVKIAVDVSKSFEAIATGNAKVNDLIGEIAAASKEQSQGIDQVNGAVAEMDKVTQQNAASSEESASSAEELSGQAEELQSMVAQFILSQSTQKKPAAAVRQIAHAPARTEHKQPRIEMKKAPAHKKVEKFSAEDVIPMESDVLKEF